MAATEGPTAEHLVRAHRRPPPAVPRVTHRRSAAPTAQLGAVCVYTSRRPSSSTMIEMTTKANTSRQGRTDQPVLQRYPGVGRRSSWTLLPLRLLCTYTTWRPWLGVCCLGASPYVGSSELVAREVCWVRLRQADTVSRTSPMHVPSPPDHHGGGKRKAAAVRSCRPHVP